MDGVHVRSCCTVFGYLALRAECVCLGSQCPCQQSRIERGALICTVGEYYNSNDSLYSHPYTTRFRTAGVGLWRKKILDLDPDPSMGLHTSPKTPKTYTPKPKTSERSQRASSLAYHQQRSFSCDQSYFLEPKGPPTPHPSPGIRNPTLEPYGTQNLQPLQR